jgi:hypothetical protein
MSNEHDWLARLTPEELKVILDTRRKKTQRVEAERVVAEVLNTAAQWYNRWHKVGGGDYIHFCEQFGENGVGLNQPDFFEIVERTIECVFEFVRVDE